MVKYDSSWLGPSLSSLQEGQTHQTGAKKEKKTDAKIIKNCRLGKSYKFPLCPEKKRKKNKTTKPPIFYIPLAS